MFETVKRKDVHVVPHKDGWTIKKEDAKRATKIVETKQPAISEAGKIAKKDEFEVVINNKEKLKIWKSKRSELAEIYNLNEQFFMIRRLLNREEAETKYLSRKNSISALAR